MDMVKTLGSFVELLKTNPNLPQDFYSIDLTASLPDLGISAHLRGGESETALLEWALFLGSAVAYGEASRVTGRWTRKVSVTGDVGGLRVNIYAFVRCEVEVKQASFIA